MDLPADRIAARATQPISVGGAAPQRRDASGAAPPPAGGDKAPVVGPAPPRDKVAARWLTSSALPGPVRLDEQKFFRIGRDRACDICFPSTHVSRTHAEVTLEKGTWVVGDLGSRNGTQVNGERVLRRTLKHGDLIQIGGHFELLYEELTAEDVAARRGKKQDVSSDTLKLSQDEIGFFGDVKRLSVVEVVQLLSQNRKTGILTIVEEKSPERRLYLLEGNIVHAEFGNASGPHIPGQILRARAGRFAFRPTPEAEVSEKRTVETPTQVLLLQAMESPRSS